MIDAMKQALQALEGSAPISMRPTEEHKEKHRAAITALRAAIEAAERAEPVAYVNNDGFIIEVDDMGILEGTKLYAHPPAITADMVERAYEVLSKRTRWVDVIDVRDALEAALGVKHAE